MAELCPACKAQVVWAIRVQSAAGMAVAAEPTAAGSMMLEPGWDGRPRARRVTPKLLVGRKLLHVPHTMTCTRKDALKLHSYCPPDRD